MVNKYALRKKKGKRRRSPPSGIFINRLPVHIPPRGLDRAYADPAKNAVAQKRAARRREPCLLRLRRTCIHRRHDSLGHGELLRGADHLKAVGKGTERRLRSRGDNRHRLPVFLQVCPVARQGHRLRGGAVDTGSGLHDTGRNLLLHLPDTLLRRRREQREDRGTEELRRAVSLHLLLPSADRRTYCQVRRHLRAALIA